MCMEVNTYESMRSTLLLPEGAPTIHNQPSSRDHVKRHSRHNRNRPTIVGHGALGGQCIHSKKQ